MVAKSTEHREFADFITGTYDRRERAISGFIAYDHKYTKASLKFDPKNKEFKVNKALLNKTFEPYMV